MMPKRSKEKLQARLHLKTFTEGNTCLSCIRWNTNRQWSLRLPGRLAIEDMNAFRCYL